MLTETAASALIEAAHNERTVVYLGNRNAVEVVEDPTLDSEQPGHRIRRPLPKAKRCTTVTLAPGLGLMEAAYDLTHTTRGVWQAHSDAPTPAWVASTDPVLAQLLASHWGCELRDPEPDHTSEGGQ